MSRDTPEPCEHCGGVYVHLDGCARPAPVFVCWQCQEGRHGLCAALSAQVSPNACGCTDVVCGMLRREEYPAECPAEEWRSPMGRATVTVEFLRRH